jgi:plastocyanin
MRKLLAGLLASTVFAAAGTAAAAERSFTLVNVEYEGTKVWVPATLIVQKGDTVKIKLINNVKSDPNQHGFALPDFKVAAVVDRGEPKTVEFVADKAGLFSSTCQLHPAHIGGQLLVLDK